MIDAQEVEMGETIDRITLTHIRIPLKEPYRDSAGEVANKDAIIVEIETRGGLVGLGECSPACCGAGDSADDVETCWNNLANRIVPGLVGRSFPDVEAIASATPIWNACDRRAVAAIDTALWDLVGQSRKASIAAILGADPVDVARGVESGLTLGPHPTVIDLLRSIELHLIEGYKRVKIEIVPGRDIEPIRAVRSHFGDELELMVDGKGLYTSTDLDTFRALDDLDLLMIEQPMAADDLDGLATLQAALATPICLDETARTLQDVEAAISRRACRIVSLSLQRLGGFGPALAIHDLCLAHGIACWVGGTPELGIGQAHGIHLGTLRNCKYPSDLAPASRWFVDDCVVPAVEMVGPGVFTVPDRPGLGYIVDPAKLRRYDVRRREFVVGNVA
jgi:O-succinylbenzoate synthase